MKERTHLAGALLDYVYVTKLVLEELDVTCSVTHLYALDDGAVKLK